MSRTYPDIYIPSAFQEINQLLPPLPRKPSQPSQPSNNTPPEKVPVEWLTVLGIGTILISALTQSFLVFLTLAAITAIVAVVPAWTYPKRLAQFEQEIQQAEQEYQRNHQRYLQELDDYDRQVYWLHSEDNIQKYRQNELAKLTRRTSLPDGNTRTGRIGVSERNFKRYLLHYFSNKIKTGVALKIPDFEYPYSPDFCYIDGNLCIDIEIDEPYIGHTGEPYHCVSSWKESQRNQFFLDQNWIVIRFAEEQVCRYPESCCKVVAQVISKITGESISSKFQDIPDLKPMNRWDEREAQVMADQRYRDTYLP